MLVAIALAAAATAPPSPPPDVVARVAAELGEGAAAPTTPPPVMFRAVDVNGDGVADWLVSYETAGEVAWCGTGGCQYQLFVSRPGGDHIVAFHETARTLAVRGGRVIADVYGSYCGMAGVIDCRRVFSWDTAEASLVPVVGRGQEPRLFGPLFQPVPLPRERWPDSVTAVVDERAATCAEAGATLDDGALAVVRSPDLDGDGVSDWIVGSPYSSCMPPDTMSETERAKLPIPLLVALAGDPAAPAVIFQSAIPDYAVDITHHPAALLLLPDSDGQILRCPARPTRCRVTTFNYDVEKRWLEPFTPARAAPRSPPSPRTGRRRAR